MLNKGKGLISLSQIESGDTLFLTLEELISYIKKLNPDDFRRVTDAIKESDLDPALKKKINEIKPYDDTELRNKISNLETFKADKATLEHDYRKNAVLINFNDLDSDLQSKINAVVNGGYDDAEIRQQIQNLFTTKLSKIEAESKYRDKNVAIGKLDLDEHLNSLIDNWEFQDEKIAELEDNKADKTELENYRKKNVAISKADLDLTLRETIDNIPPPYDDTHILLVLEELRNTKADKAALTLYLKKSEADLLYRQLKDKITLLDLDESIIRKIGLIPDGFDPVTTNSNLSAEIAKLKETKLDKSILDTLRLKTELIKESDLTEELADKVNAIAKGYDDTELREAIQNLQSEKLGAEVASKTYRKLAVAIEEEDLSTDVRFKLNNSAYDDSELRNRIKLAEETLKLKDDITSVDKKLESYRHKEVKITEVDLDKALIDKIEAIRESYDDTEIRGLIKELQNNKADKVTLNNYKLKSEPVTEDELSQDLRDKVNTISNGYDDREVKSRLSELESGITTKLSIEDAKTTYRAKAQEIVETDLAKEVKDKLNKEYNDQPIKESISTINNNLAKKIDKSVADTTYRFKSTLIAESDLTEDLKAKINKTSEGGTEVQPEVDVTKYFNLNYLLGLTNEPEVTKAKSLRFIKGKTLTFKRGLFFNQKESELNAKAVPVLFNNGGIVSTSGDVETDLKVKLSSVEGGYKISLLNREGYKKGTNNLTLSSNGVYVNGLTNVVEDTLEVTVVDPEDIKNSVTLNNMRLHYNDDATLPLNPEDIDMDDLNAKLADTSGYKNPKVLIDIHMDDINFYIDGSLQALQCEKNASASITKQEIVISNTTEQISIELSEFVKLPKGATYTLVGPTFNLSSIEGNYGTTKAPSMSIKVKGEPERPDVPEKPEREKEFELEFILKEGVFDLALAELPDWDPSWIITGEDIYAVETEFLNPKAEIRYLGPSNTQEKEGTVVRREGVDIDNALPETPNGYYSFDAESSMYVVFQKANISPMKYKVVKYK